MKLVLTPSALFACLQLVLEAHNVPELSAGVNCTFEDLAEMNGLVEGNRIKCFSPAEKEMPRIIVDKGEDLWLLLLTFSTFVESLRQQHWI